MAFGSRQCLHAPIAASTSCIVGITQISFESQPLLYGPANKSIASPTTGVTVSEPSKMMEYYRQKVIELRTELNVYNDRSLQLKQVSEKLDSQIKEEEKKIKTGTYQCLQAWHICLHCPCKWRHWWVISMSEVCVHVFGSHIQA